jgi:hypothetical protein
MLERSVLWGSQIRQIQALKTKYSLLGGLFKSEGVVTQEAGWFVDA